MQLASVQIQGCDENREEKRKEEDNEISKLK